jgi:hypothetical protein
MSSIEGKGKGKSKEEPSDHRWSAWGWDSPNYQWYRTRLSENGTYIYDYEAPSVASPLRSNTQDDYQDIAALSRPDYRQPLVTLHGDEQEDYEVSKPDYQQSLVALHGDEQEDYEVSKPDYQQSLVALHGNEQEGYEDIAASSGPDILQNSS